MAEYRRANIDGGTFFFSVVTFRRGRFLCDPEVRAALRAAIDATRTRYPFTVEAWVLLPDHMHCLWTLPPGDHDFGRRWSMIKRMVSQHCRHLHHPELLDASRRRRRESTVWQRRFWEHAIRDDRDFRNHCDYIHYNPVKHGLADTPSAWPFSTFHRFVRQGRYEPDWGVGDPPGNLPAGNE